MWFCQVEDPDADVDEVMAGPRYALIRAFGREVHKLVDKIRRVAEHHQEVYHFIYRNMQLEMASS